MDDSFNQFFLINHYSLFFSWITLKIIISLRVDFVRTVYVYVDFFLKFGEGRGGGGYPAEES